MMFKGNTEWIVLTAIAVIVIVAAAIYMQRPPEIEEPEESEQVQKEIVVYFPSWATYRDRNNMTVGMIPWDKVTVVKHAFFTVDPNFKLQSLDYWADFDKQGPNSEGLEKGDLRGHFAEYKHYAALHPDVDILVSVGGWTGSGNFHHMALTADSRAIFIDDVVYFLLKHPFIDGIDLNWEFPGAPGKGNPYGPEDKENYVSLIRELRKALNERGLPERMLTVAMSATFNKMALQSPDIIHHYLNHIAVMTYDFAGSWSSVTNHQAAIFPNPNSPFPMLNASSSMLHLRDYFGVPAYKLLVGSPFYSRGWKNVDPDKGSNGLFANASGAPMGELDTPNAPGGVNAYKRMRELENTPGYEKFRDPYSQVPWLFNRSTGVMYTYEDEISAAARADFILKHGFGGVMIWEISLDGDGLPLLNVFYNKLTSGRAVAGAAQ